MFTQRWEILPLSYSVDRGLFCLFLWTEKHFLRARIQKERICVHPLTSTGKPSTILKVSENLDALREQLAAAQAALEAAEKEAALKAVQAAQTQALAAAGIDPASPLSNFAQAMHNAYSFPEKAITIGTLIDGTLREPRVTARMPLNIFNRHLLVAGATGSGKTRTLQLLTEGLSSAGTSVLLSDVKGDLTGIAEAGSSSDKLLARTKANGQPWASASFPTELLTLGGVDSQFPGVTVRARISDFGPILLARALSLNTTQEQCLQLIFLWADNNGLELVDLSDLRAVISFLTSDEGKEELAGIGGVSKATAGVILRALSTLEAQGGNRFFGDPAFDTDALIRQVEHNGSLHGLVSVLAVGDIAQRPALISAVIMWLLANLFSGLPEVGDVETPKLVFVFDEAHLLFADATKEFVRQVVQTVRLIRSKGVGVVFVTQTPKDIPSDVLAQLGSRIQHALRAVTPEDNKKLKQSIETFPDSDLDLAEVLTNLGTGEALVTVLDPQGRPTPVMPTAIWAPGSVMGPAAETTISQINAASPLFARYAEAVNPFSAEEALVRRSTEEAIRRQEAAEAAQAERAAKKQAEADARAAEKTLEREAREAERERQRAEREARKRWEKEQAAAERAEQKRHDALQSALGSMLRSAGSALGREITRSIFGTRRR